MTASIAAAYDSQILDGWARYVYWQHPNGTIMIQGRNTAPEGPVQIQQAVIPKKNSPLAALYRGTDDGADNVGFYTLSFLSTVLCIH